MKFDALNNDVGNISEQAMDFNSKEWWSLEEIGVALQTSRDRIVQLATSYLSANPEWSRKKNERTGHGILWYKDLALVLENEIKKSRKIPEGWISAAELSKRMGLRSDFSFLILKIISDKFPNINDNARNFFPRIGNTSKKTKYYSPEILKAVEEQLSKYPLMPPDYQTSNQIKDQFRSEKTQEQIPNILKILENQGKVRGTFFTSYHTALVVECFPPGTTQIVHAFLLDLAKRKEHK